jgi:hypothetical protein
MRCVDTLRGSINTLAEVAVTNSVNPFALGFRYREHHVST